MIGSIGYDNGYQARQNHSLSGPPREASSPRQEEPKKPVLNPGEKTAKLPGRRSSPAECETCRNRKYQDGSDESDVSFQTAQHIDPNAAGARVRAHEQEHVTNAYEKAEKNNGKVVSVGVSIHTAICPECGRVYVSGGETRSTISYGKGDKAKDDEEKKSGALQDPQNPYRQQSDAINRMLNTGLNASYTS